MLMGLCAYAATGAEGEGEPLPLPAWTSDKGITTDSDASPLLPYNPNFIREMEGVDSLPPSLQPGSGKPGDHFLFFIPKGAKSTPAPPASSANIIPPEKLVEVGADFLSKCEKQNPEDHFYDPQMALPETQAETLRRLLSYHREEAATAANLLLLEGNQKLPPRMDLTRIAGGRLMEGHQCLVVYPLGQPLRSRLFMSHKITSVVSATYLQELLRACVVDALQATDAEEQLQRFATQLSIRLIWMERAHPAVFERTAAEGPREPPPVMQPPKALMSEVAPPPPPVPASPWLVWRDWALARWQLLAWSAGGSLTGLILIMWRWKARRRKRRQTIWILPEATYEPRLGGPHCGGGGSWIKFG